MSPSSRTKVSLNTQSNDSSSQKMKINSFDCEPVWRVEYFLKFLVLFCFVFSQTENPNSERPYSFKDFLLHPRRLAQCHCFCLHVLHSIFVYVNLLEK